jgi:molybdopterin-guanine dinucleotide biosynthesis protein A
MVNNISGVILAGGDNKRFEGVTKANIIVGGKTIICRIIETIKEIFNEIIIVTNYPQEFISYPDIKIIRDHFSGVGPLGGIHSALKASSAESLFVFAGDMPFLDKKYIIRQIDYYSNIRTDILIPRINQDIEPLHAIYSISILGILEEYLVGKKDHSVRGFFKTCHVDWLQFDDSERTRLAFTNINSPSDIANIEKYAANRSY